MRRMIIISLMAAIFWAYEKATSEDGLHFEINGEAHSVRLFDGDRPEARVQVDPEPEPIDEWTWED